MGFFLRPRVNQAEMVKIMKISEKSMFFFFKKLSGKVIVGQMGGNLHFRNDFNI